MIQTQIKKGKTNTNTKHIQTQIEDLTCEGDLCDWEDVRKDNRINPVVPVVLRHDLMIFILFLKVYLEKSFLPFGTHRSRSRTSDG